MDFLDIKERILKSGNIEVYPDFKIIRSNDLMVRAKNFYAIWDEEKRLWSRDEYDVQRLVDEALLKRREFLALNNRNQSVSAKLMGEFSSNSWTHFKNYLSHISDSYHELDSSLTFKNSIVKKKDYISKRLPYSIEKGSCESFDELIETLYNPEERKKLYWAIGSILSGDSKEIQKFIVLYGEGGSGKSTMLNIIQKLFEGYYTTFDSRSLTSSNNDFSTEVFRDNPLVAIQHDGDLSRIEDNTKLNSIVAHEFMVMNEKYKPSYTSRANCFLFVATNKPVRITDAKSGIIRRLIDCKPSGLKIPTQKYHSLMSRIDFELGAIAYKCLEIYRNMGKNFYSNYKPLSMIFQTDIFFNFVESNYLIFFEQGGTTLSQAYEMYKEYMKESLVEYRLPKYRFREELKNYFENFYEVTRIEGKQVRSYYSLIKKDRFISEGKEISEEISVPSWLTLDSSKSLFDEYAKDFKAQYATEDGIPREKWINVKTNLSDINTQELHFVKLPENHIVIDFDIKISDKKSPEENLKAATNFPPTYGEFSKSKAGIHLHYFYDGDISKLSNLYSEGIEIKVFKGDSSLRRKLSKCNNIPIATINSGLPLKGEKVINFSKVSNEKSIRALIDRNLKKEIHPATKPSIDFIYTILEEAYNSGIFYDVSDLRGKILSFALKSTNQSDYCVKLVSKMKFSSESPSKNEDFINSPIVFFDVEVFPNLLVVCWKYEGKDSIVVRMFNPSANEIEELLKFKLIGFNCRRYDNHILYARYIGYDINSIYKLSEKIINSDIKDAGLFGEAYNISYADVYDFSTKKQSLKKFQIELGIFHKELQIPFDKEVSDDKFLEIGDYCANDVISTEVVFNDRKEDFIARKILSELSGLSINDTTQSHTAAIIFGNVKKPQEEFVYTELSTLFPGYTFIDGKSSYMGEDPGEGGYVYAETGYYENVALLDVVSMHPSSIILLNLFGPYTEKFAELTRARVAIKHKDYDLARTMLGGVLQKYLISEEDSTALAYALKIVINIVYGLTSAKFSNKFRDPRNKDNIVAKRGALFMIDLKNAVQEKGYKVIHIKTDSVKIPNSDPEIIDFVKSFGKKYGYDFEHEKTFESFCLVNDAVYIGKTFKGWETVGAQFAHPYVFKTLFSREPLSFEDKIEVKSVTSTIYLDMNENLNEDLHNYIFIGKIGSFCPIKSGHGGGVLLRKYNDKYYHITGTKGWRWLQSDLVKSLNKEDSIDLNYFRNLVDDAISKISEFIDFETFRNKGE